MGNEVIMDGWQVGRIADMVEYAERQIHDVEPEVHQSHFLKELPRRR
jgi:hypothetical protein